MQKNSFLFFLLALIASIAIIHSLGMSFFWYWHLWWLDLFVHFLGGLWVGGIFLWFFFLKKFIAIKKVSRTSVVFFVLLAVFIAGVLWEIFELKIGATFTAYEDYIFDTATDLSADLVGGLIIVIYFLKNTKYKIHNT